ncbi:hypothetical protein ALC60_09180 [Trachymyrmex zeteki]|uniref:Uncharacterized protein n=1 Tax=Mycetomoellerius zeteki TaxID=64791 RepID=A0A151WUT6_9HYME|nr:hypothetical protein ALC60_09180 [Trachymyrmex zeteki]
MVDNAYLLRRRGAFGVAVNFSGGDGRTSWYILPSNVTKGSRRDAALTIVGVDPAVAGYLAPSLLVPVTTTPGCVVRLRGMMQVRESARFLTDTFTHLASKAGTVYVGATTSDVVG